MLAVPFQVIVFWQMGNHAKPTGRPFSTATGREAGIRSGARRRLMRDIFHLLGQATLNVPIKAPVASPPGVPDPPKPAPASVSEPPSTTSAQVVTTGQRPWHVPEVFRCPRCEGQDGVRIPLVYDAVKT